MSLESFQKKFGTVLKVWAVPAFVITVLKTLVIDVPQIVRKIPTDVSVTVVLGMLLTFSISLISIVVGAPRGGLRDHGIWKRQHYATAFGVFVALWILQAIVPGVRRFLSVMAVALPLSLFFTGIVYGVVYVWRKLPR